MISLPFIWMIPFRYPLLRKNKLFLGWDLPSSLTEQAFLLFLLFFFPSPSWPTLLDDVTQWLHDQSFAQPQHPDPLHFPAFRSWITALQHRRKGHPMIYITDWILYRTEFHPRLIEIRFIEANVLYTAKRASPARMFLCLYTCFRKSD